MTGVLNDEGELFGVRLFLYIIIPRSKKALKVLDLQDIAAQVSFYSHINSMWLNQTKGGCKCYSARVRSEFHQAVPYRE